MSDAPYRTTLHSLIAATCLIGVTTPSLSAQGDLPERVDRLFEAWDHERSAGAAVAIVQNGAVVYTQGYGMADLERGSEVTPSTVFTIASVSKQFTGFAIVSLAEGRVLSLDDDLRDHLPEVPDFGTTITLRHLLHHTSGLRDLPELMLVSGFRTHDVHDATRYWNLIRAQRELNFEPGTAYQYSNTGYFLLSEVVARVTGKSFRTWLHEHAFEPLGMGRSHVHDDPGELIPNRARSYEMDGGGAFKNNPVYGATVGSGGIYSTAEDLAKWILNLETKIGTGDAVVARMLERGQLESGEELSYAAGLTIDAHRGLRRVSHGGRANGFLSQLAIYPEQRLGIAVLSNGYPMEPLLDPTALSESIAELYLGEHMRTPEAVAHATDPVEVPRADLERVVGWYWHSQRNYTRRIVMRGNRLMLRLTSGRHRQLRPLGDDQFAFAEGNSRTTFAFEPTGETPRRMTVKTAHGHDVFDAVDTPARPAPRVLREYAGTYYSPELRVALSFAERDGQLRVQSIGRPEATLRPIIRDHFNQGHPWWLGYDIHFQRDETERVVGLRVSNYHAANIRFDKRGE